MAEQEVAPKPDQDGDSNSYQNAGGNNASQRGRGGRGRERGPYKGGPMRRRGGFPFNQNRSNLDSKNHNLNNQEFRGGPRGFRGGRGGQVMNRYQPYKDGEGVAFAGPVDKIAEKIANFHGPTYDLPPLDLSEKKFNGSNRLFIGNISAEITNEELMDMFKPYGETSEIFVNREKNFGFITLDYHKNTEKAKRELDGTVMKGKSLKIRFAPNNATIKLKNLNPYITNELLYVSFSPFGEIEKVHVNVDERGKPTGEGQVHFARKFSAAAAIKKCSEGCYFLTSSLQPIIAEAFEVVEDVDGFSDKHTYKKHPDFLKERECPPRFAQPNSFEFEFGNRWKELYQLYQQKEETLKREFAMEKEKLQGQMECAKYEHDTEMLRNELKVRELEKERQKREWEMRKEHVESEKQKCIEMLKKQEEKLEARMLAAQADVIRRQQENTLFMQAHNLDNLLNQQEQAFNQSGGPGGNLGGRGQCHGGPARGAGHWVKDTRRMENGDKFQNKRRRF